MAQSRGRRAGCCRSPGSVPSQSQVLGHRSIHTTLLRGGDAREAEEKPETLRPYRVISATGHISYDHIWDWQNLPVFRLLDEDGHTPGDQLAVILYPLRPGDELPVRVVSWGDQSQESVAATSTCPSLTHRGLVGHFCPPM